jgi:hypothetical protein
MADSAHKAAPPPKPAGGPVPTVVARNVVSKPNANVRVTEIKLSQGATRALSTQVKKLGASK